MLLKHAQLNKILPGAWRKRMIKESKPLFNQQKHPSTYVSKIYYFDTKNQVQVILPNTIFVNSIFVPYQMWQTVLNIEMGQNVNLKFIMNGKVIISDSPSNNLMSM